MESELTHPNQRHEAVDDVTVVHFTGVKVSLDEETLTSIRDELYALADETGQSRLLLDFSSVDYVSSMALAMLVTLHKRLHASGRLLTIHNLTPQVHEVFKATRLDKFLHLWPEESRSPLSPQGRNSDSPIGVLVVDDDPAVRLVLRSWLGRKGFVVWTAAHGLEAVDLYRRHQHAIAVVLLDVIMPGMDGPHTLAALQQVSPNIQCCFMTGNPLSHTEKDLLLRGAVRVFRKPFAFTEVVDTLNRLASQPAQGRQDRWIEIPVERRATNVGTESQAG
jgi:anti-sigma B factor antagonist